MDFLKQDLDNLFNDKGVDKSQYDDKVNFMDPITKYGSVTGISSASFTFWKLCTGTIFSCLYVKDWQLS